MDVISLQEYPRKRCAPSSPLEDSILLRQPKRSCSSEYYLHEMSNSYRLHDICADGNIVPTLARKTASHFHEEQMECSDSSGSISENNNNDTRMEAKKGVESSNRSQQENSIPNLYVSSSFRRSPVKCRRCCAGEPGHFNHLTS